MIWIKEGWILFVLIDDKTCCGLERFFYNEITHLGNKSADITGDI